MEGDLEVGAPATFEELSDAWDTLAPHAGSIFATREWAATWWDHHPDRGRLALHPITSAGRLVGILPLYIRPRLGLRVGRILGHAGGDELGPVCGPGARAAIARMLNAGAWRRAIPADVLLLEALPAVDWAQAVPGVELRRTASPTTALPPSWSAFLESLSRKLRREITHGERRLSRAYRVEYRTTTDPERLDADLDTFFALHRARWPSGSSLLAREAFYRAFGATALRRGWLRLTILDLDGAPAAARLDFRYGTVHFAYNAGRDPRFSRESLGLQLRARTLRDAIEDGMTEYRLLRGPEPYKYRLATSDRGALTVAVPGTAAGRLATLGARAAAGLRLGRRVLSGSLDASPSTDDGRRRGGDGR